MGKRIAVALVAVIALAACGSSNSSGAGAGGNGSHLSSPSGATNGGGSSTNDFASVVGKAKTATYKVTYSNSDGGSFTIAQDPPKFSLIEGESATYVTSDGSSVSCAGSGSAARCTQLPGTGTAVQQGMASAFGAVGTLFTTLASENLHGLLNISTTGKSIAGRDAECATIDKNSLGVLGAAIGDASYQVCMDKDTGVMLSSKASNGSGKADSITATDFGSPSDSDFTPPATPTTVP
jgi:hypothetical protein